MRIRLYALRKWALGASLLFLALAVIQAAVFYTVANRSFETVPADLAVLFKGAGGRTDFFYRMVEIGGFEKAFVPGASEKVLALWAKKYDVSGEVRHLPATPPTSSTFEDALAAADAIRAHGIGSVVLVTSDYHVPRSWFLLRLMTIGGGVTIQPVEVPSRMRLAGFWVRAKMIYNEMVNFWGSLSEWVYYKASGGLLSGNNRAMAVVGVLKRILLFDEL